MVSTVLTKLGDKWYDLDSGIAYTVEVLNKKGYKTRCSCEGHLREWTSKAWNYNYSPVWISFERGFEPKTPPVIEGYERKMENPWKSKYSGWYLGDYETLKGCYDCALWIGFSFYKKEINGYRGGIHAEHDRVLRELEKWADALPNRGE